MSALLSTQPESGLASGSKKYSYNTAGYLTKVEGYTGTAWYTQAEMSYTGLGDRLSMTGSTDVKAGTECPEKNGLKCPLMNGQNVLYDLLRFGDHLLSIG
jgi:hypothetical protein